MLMERTLQFKSVERNPPSGIGNRLDRLRVL
jgi:hypothetical protein